MIAAYYVVARHNSARTAWLAGPFPSEASARVWCSPARVAAEDIDPYIHFASVGVMRVQVAQPRDWPAGVLNDRLGVPVF